MKLAILALAARTEIQRWRGITINHPPRTLIEAGRSRTTALEDGTWGCTPSGTPLCIRPHGTEKNELFLSTRTLVPFWEFYHCDFIYPRVSLKPPFSYRDAGNHSIQDCHPCFSPDANQLRQKEDSKDRMDRVLSDRKWSESEASRGQGHVWGRVWRTQPGECRQWPH